MFKLIVENEAGNRLDLTKNPDYTLIKVTGLLPPGAAINSQAEAGKDGERYNSSRMNKRNIVLTLHPEEPVEKNRNNLYQYFPAKQNIRLYYKNDIRDVYIDGRVETIDGDFFSTKEQLQISILCPQPYFIGCGEDSGVLHFPVVVDLLEFPTSFPKEGIVFSELLPNERAIFENKGMTESGAEFHFFFNGKSEGVKISDIRNGGYLGVKYDFQPWDNLYICTVQGRKSIRLKRGLASHNLLNHRLPGSSWLPVKQGQNVFAVEAANYEMELRWEERFEGV